ncbi:AAA family ATPase, partial [Candidatus Poribacteria bacterium]|nr:AAA family ATPase [Candidatus Poribacteria bacterium]
MSKLLDGLNPSQQTAVTHTDGPLLIIAGPGSGKTRTVVHSIAYAIENGVMPEQILAFSFTVKASEELRDRVKEIVGEEKGYLVNISTFHSFCRQVLKEDIDKLGRGYARNFRALEENDQRKIVKDLARINEQRGRAEIEPIQFYKYPNPDEVLNFIKKCKARELSPSDAGPHAHEFHRSED